MLRNADKIREVSGVDARALPDELLTATEPVVLRGLVAHWPMVRAALESEQAAIRYLLGFCRDAAVVALVGPPQIQGRFFYNEDLSGFNFRTERLRLDALLNELGRPAGATPGGSLYVGSTTLTAALPGFHEQNNVDLGPRKPLISIWLGNRSRIAAHNDLPDNLACVAAGHRRFTLFPPEQLANLYIGPLDFAPTGAPMSLVDFAAPDYERFPRFRTALAHAVSAELGPGDAIFIPPLWWHHVQSLHLCNILINYWWGGSSSVDGDPLAGFNSLTHALITLRQLPAPQRAAWAAVFAYYVFGDVDESVAHIPQARRGVLGTLSAEARRERRAFLAEKLKG